MVDLLLILFAAVVYYIAGSWFLEGFKKEHSDEGGRIFGGIALIIATAITVCYLLDFVYPVVIMLGIVAGIFVILGLSFLNDKQDVFIGSNVVFGVCVLFFGLFSGLLMSLLMLEEGWYTGCACVISAFMALVGVITIKKSYKMDTFSFSYLITFGILLIASLTISSMYPTDHALVFGSCFGVLLISSFFYYMNMIKIPVI